jgi:CBS domain-containing protein
MDIELNLTTESVVDTAPMEPVCVEPGRSVGEVFQLLKQQNAGCVLICRDGVLKGIFTERDALRWMARGGRGLDTQIETLMVRDPVTLANNSTVAHAIQKMSSGGYRRLPIVDGEGRPLGVVQASSIVHYLVQHFPKTIYNQPPVAHPVTQQREGS